VAFLIFSVMTHLTLWWLISRLPPREEPPAKKESLRITVVDKPTPPKPPAPEKAQPKAPQVVERPKLPPRPEPKIPTPVAPQRAFEPTPSDKPYAADVPKPSEKPTATPTPGSDRIAGGVPNGKPQGGNREGGGSSGPTDLGQVRLFDSDALKGTVRRWNSNQPGKREFMASGADGDPNDPIAEKARVGGRIAADIQSAQTEGMVAGGLLSTCNDGVDQGMDGFMDCADPGCRQMPACRNTAEYSSRDSGQIPDDSVVGVTSEVVVPDSGTIKTASIRINVTHASPGDLSIELEHQPSGRKIVLKQGDRSNRFLQKAYLLRDLIGDDPRGRWIIHIRDVFPGVVGSWRGWTLYITE
jgi:hypothetical protein